MTLELSIEGKHYSVNVIDKETYAHSSYSHRSMTTRVSV